MNRVDFTFDEYQACVLRTANRTLDWNQTVENCLFGLIGELGEIVEGFGYINPVFESVYMQGQFADDIKKEKYHGKIADLSKYPENLHATFKACVEYKPSFEVSETANLVKELGDLLYYLTWLIDTLGYEASEVAQQNVEKLRKRYGDGFSVEASLNRKN